MLVIFTHEFQYTPEDEVNRIISGLLTMPVKVMESIDNLEMIDFEILQEMERGKGYGSLDARRIYFAWEIIFPTIPSIGWSFNGPLDLGYDSINTITNIYFGTGNVLLREYE